MGEGSISVHIVRKRVYLKNHADSHRNDPAGSFPSLWFLIHSLYHPLIIEPYHQDAFLLSAGIFLMISNHSRNIRMTFS